MQRMHDIYRPMEERKGDWREVELMLSDAELKEQILRRRLRLGRVARRPRPRQRQEHPT